MKLKESPEDFVVEEIPLYEPGGAGEHVYVRFEKRDLTTDAAVQRIANALGANMRDVGVAGMKDKRAVTTQTVSFRAPPGAEEKLAAVNLAPHGIRVLEVKRHGNKLKTGHLKGNRFVIVAREVANASAAAEKLRAAAGGVPNAFGEQRFGRDADNATRAKACVLGQAPWPRDARLKRLLFSALQSAMFNEVLARRVADGTWCVPQAGDLLRKTDSGGLFLCEDVATDRERASRGEVSPTGPMFGAKMPEPGPGSAVAALEHDVRASWLGELDLAPFRPLGEGARRPMRLEVAELDVIVRDESTLEVRFVLPRGAYATTVLATVAPASAETAEAATQPETTPDNDESADD